MAEFLTGELWYCIARNSFDVWRVLIRTVATFWRYIKKIDTGRSIFIVEKLFGKTSLEICGGIIWKIREMSWRANGLPFYVDSLNSVRWMERGKKPTNIYSHGFMEFRHNDLSGLDNHGGYSYGGEVEYVVYEDGTYVDCHINSMCSEWAIILRTENPPILFRKIYTYGELYTKKIKNGNSPERIMSDGRFVYSSF